MQSDRKSEENHDDAIYFGNGGSMPRDLRAISRRIVRLLRVAGISAIVLAIITTAIPERYVVEFAAFSNRALWSYFDVVAFSKYAERHYIMAYTTSVVTVSWVITVVLAVTSVPIAIQNWKVSRIAYCRGYAPWGKDRAGRPIAPRSPVFSAIVGAGAGLFFVVILIGLVKLELLCVESGFSVGRARYAPFAFIIYGLTAIIIAIQLLSVCMTSIWVIAIANIIIPFKEPGSAS